MSRWLHVFCSLLVALLVAASAHPTQAWAGTAGADGSVGHAAHASWGSAPDAPQRAGHCAGDHDAAPCAIGASAPACSDDGCAGACAAVPVGDRALVSATGQALRPPAALVGRIGPAATPEKPPPTA